MAEKTEAFDRYKTASVPLVPNAADAGDLTGRLFGGFRIIRKLGQGGMGQVFLAEQLSLKRLVALKFLKPQLAENKTALERFKREALSVAKTSHANIVQIYDVGEESGIHYMALEYVEGKNLREFIEKKGPPEVKLGLHIMNQVAAALQTASELGIVHRDIKPENILINKKGGVKVTDFGLSFKKDSNLTESRIAMGTPLYISPEQVEGRPVDNRTDIYSFGVSCYHLFTGRPPFKGESPFEVALQHVNKEPTPLTETRPDLPIDLCRLVHKMMAKQPDQRYQNGREIQRDITKLRDALTASGGTLAAPVLPELFTASIPVGATQQLTQSAIQPVRRQRMPWALIGTAFAMLAGGAVAGWYLTPPPTLAVPAPPAKVEKPDVPAAVQALFDPKEREKKLERQVRDVLDSPVPKDRKGIDVLFDYSALLLREHRLAEAEALFRKLNPDGKGAFNGYRWIVEFGQAMVLAQRDKYAESNRLFKTALDGIEKLERASASLPEPKSKNRLFFLRHWEKNLDWREQMAWALQRNHDNSPKDFPADPRLETLRRPPAVVSVGAKAAGGGP